MFFIFQIQFYFLLILIKQTHFRKLSNMKIVKYIVRFSWKWNVETMHTYSDTKTCYLIQILDSTNSIHVSTPLINEMNRALGDSPQYCVLLVGWGRNIFVSFKPPRPGNEPRTLAWKAAVPTTIIGPPPSRH